MDNNRHPLLSRREEEEVGENYQITHGRPISSSFSSSFVDGEDIAPIKDSRQFFKEFSIEAKKLWLIAGPAIFTSVAQYSLGAITQVFSGHLGTLELAAVSIQNFVISGFTFGILVKTKLKIYIYIYI